jgi:two-component system, sensor histidine kinase RegB
MTFANASDPFLTVAERPVRSGALVELVWRTSRIVVAAQPALGANTVNQA